MKFWLFLLTAMAVGCGGGYPVADTHRAEYEHGKKCRVNGVPANANPYAGDNLHTSEALLWLDGWIDGGSTEE